VTDEDELSEKQLAAIDLRYETCARSAELYVQQSSSVGLLRNGMEATAEQCAAAASGTSLGGGLDINDRGVEETGFVVGSALCAVTPEGRVARATITAIVKNSSTSDYPAVELTLTTWVRSE